MIKLNTPYHVAEENVTVTFTEVKNGAIIGAYPNATLTGTLEGNVLSATFHNTAVNAVGLIELTFNENGFEGKWKNGLEPGPMRGKWSGECLSDSAKDSSGPATLTPDQLKWIEGVRYNWDYEEAPKEWLDSKEFMLAVVTKDGSALKYASDKLKDDIDIVIAAIENGGMANVTIESFLIELSQKSSISGKKVDFKVPDLVKAIETLFLNKKIGELDESHENWSKQVKEISEQWFEVNQMIYKNLEMDGESLNSLAQAGFNKFGPCPTNGKTIDEYNRNFLIEAINKQDDALKTIISNSLCQLEYFNYSDLIPKANELLWNKCEKSYWNALNTIGLYNEDEDITELIEELSRDFVIKVIRETREFDEGTDEEKDEFERFVSDNGLE